MNDDSTMRLAIDLDQLSEGAEQWWRSLTPTERGVFMQALWEIEEEPAPRRIAKQGTNEPET